MQQNIRVPVTYLCIMVNIILKFPPILGGNGDAKAYGVLALIVLLVVIVFYFGYRFLQRDQAE